MSPASSNVHISALIGPGEPAPVRAVQPAGTAPVLLVCDHAANRIPESLDGLGLPAPELARHIAWDIGAALVTEHLARLLDAQALLTTYSRLVVDVNRTPDHPTLIAEESDGAQIPGNRGLSDAARRQRLEQLYRPYHDAVAQAVERFLAQSVRPVLLSIHSFTPVWDGFSRPWQLGVLWARDGRLAHRMLAALRAEPDLTVGDNEPYSALTGPNQTLDEHAEARGLASAALEIRQDLIETEAGAAAWAGRLAQILKPLLLDPALHAPK